MTVLVSPAEREPLSTAGPSSSLVEEYGCDFLVFGKEDDQGFIIGVQRKAFPGDFLSSIQDGRFATLLPKMVQADMRLLLLEGRPTWTSNGSLVNYDYGRSREFRRSHLRSILMSLQWTWGVNVIWTDDPYDTVEFLSDLDRWAQKDHHAALGVRPGPKSTKLRSKLPSKKDEVLHFLQGIRGWGIEVARAVWDEFERVPLVLEKGDAERLRKVNGVGPKRLEALERMLE